MTARGEAFKELQVPDMERRLASMLMVGVVSELDEQNARVRVSYGKNNTAWLPWTVARAGGDRQWSAPEPGEQVLMASPSGDMAQGVIVGSIYRDAHPAPANSKDVTATEWSDGARQEYNRSTHAHTLEVPAGGRIVLRIGGTEYELTASGATIKAPQITFDTPHAHFTGEVTSDGDQIADGVSQINHRHIQTMAGPGVSGIPQK